MGIFGGSSSPSTDSSSKEVKEALFKQVQAESAMSNARTLISVRYILIQENIIQYCANVLVSSNRTSTNTASKPAFPIPEPPCPPANRPA